MTSSKPIIDIATKDRIRSMRREGEMTFKQIAAHFHKRTEWVQAQLEPQDLEPIVRLRLTPEEATIIAKAKRKGVGSTATGRLVGRSQPTVDLYWRAMRTDEAHLEEARRLVREPLSP
jgi:hypothetical protein